MCFSQFFLMSTDIFLIYLFCFVCFVLFDGSLIGSLVLILPSLPSPDFPLSLPSTLLPPPPPFFSSQIFSLHIWRAILPEKTNLLEQTASFSLRTKHFPFHHLFTFPSFFSFTTWQRHPAICPCFLFNPFFCVLKACGLFRKDNSSFVWL